MLLQHGGVAVDEYSDRLCTAAEISADGSELVDFEQRLRRRT
jgi:hypothetical protein